MTNGIIDTHVHIWNFERAEYDWLKNNTTILARNYEIEELEPARLEAGITGGLLMQAANNFEETDYMLEVAAKTDWINGVVGWLPLSDPAGTATALKQYVSNPYFKAVRHLMHDEPDARWLLQDNILQSLSLLDAYAIPYDIVAVKPEHIRTALEVASRVPGLRMIFDHCSQPPIATRERFGEWGELMKEAAQHPNFYVKISGLGTASKNSDQWRANDIAPYVGFVLEHYGEDRCCCGGDWPVSLLAGSYVNTWKQYLAVLTRLLNERQLEKVLYSNAVAFYNL